MISLLDRFKSICTTSVFSPIPSLHVRKCTLAVLAIVLGFHFVLILISNTSMDEWRFVNIPLHAVVESLGVATGLFVAIKLLVMSKYGIGPIHPNRIAHALIAMGLFDGFHAAINVGNNFVWLHSLATFFGGVLFLSVVLPEQRQRSRYQTWTVFLTALCIGVASLLFPDLIPDMSADLRFTKMAIALHIVGGFFLLIAAFRFLLDYSSRQSMDSFLFFIFCMLLGIAALTFPYSALWDMAWWCWHFIRLMAYFVILLFYILLNVRLVRRLETEKRSAQEKSAELSITNKLLEEGKIALSSLAHELEVIIDAIPGLIFYKDAENNLLRVNKFFADAHHTDKANLEGVNCFDLYPEREAQAYWDDDRQVIDSGVPRLNIVEPWDVEDGRRWVLTSKIPYTDGTTTKRVVAVSIDITKQKRLEEELRDIMADLERSNAELEQFAYVASHDLRSPLRAIESLSEWIEQDAGDVLPKESSEHLRLLRGRVQRMENLLDGLLEYSRIGRIQSKPERVDVGVMVEDIINDLSVDGRFTLSKAQLPCLETPASPLRQVFQNLIGNAIKHHNSGQGVIFVKAREVGAHYEFTVEDDGPGIPQQHRQKVFEMFQTLRPRDEVEGSGMGLAIVKKVVESYGGAIRVEDAQPHGARFIFTWPIKIEQ